MNYDEVVAQQKMIEDHVAEEQLQKRAAAHADYMRVRQEQDEKLAKVIGPVLNSILPEGSSVVLVIAYENDPTKMAILSPISNADRLVLLTYAAANTATQHHQELVKMMQETEVAHQNNMAAEKVNS